MTTIWLVVLFPLLGAVLNGFLLRRVPKAISHIVGASALIAAFICALITFNDLVLGSAHATIIRGFDWIEAGGFHAPFELVIDRLSGMMMLIITGIGSLIHIYAGGYMHEEEKTWRFFSYLNLFVFMMLLLVLGNNLLVMFVGWEGVGLCSYLLIGYWYQDDANAAAGMKAFLVNRIGDMGFLLGIFMTYKFFGTISFSELKEMIMAAGTLDPVLIHAIGWITLALFVGATGKSAQLPLYIWLPDAMAGPTPVSALIHAATMVTAGIYMMTRMSFFFYLAPTTQMIVAFVGGATALFAATIAICQNDIKKVLAYSTVSQLGFMVMACGVGAYTAGVFHLFTHACFKALLFMGAGSVIVAMHHEQDMLKMGGLRKYMPITHIVMLVGVLAIIGFPGLSGFFSKDEILWRAYTGGGWALWGLGAAAALCTSFYMVRLLMLTFYGPNRSDHHTQEHLHETSAVMWAPLIVLALLSAFGGYLNIPPLLQLGLPNGIFEHYLEPIVEMPLLAKQNWEHLTAEHSHSMEWALMGFSVLGMFISASIAIAFYGRGPSSVAANLKARFSGIHRTLTNKYYVDEFYASTVVEPLKEMSLFLWRVVDVVIVDGIVNGIGQACLFIGGFLSFRSTGSMHRYGMAIMIGLICMLTALLV